MVTHRTQIRKADPFGILPHPGYQVIHHAHDPIVPLLVSVVKWGSTVSRTQGAFRVSSENGFHPREHRCICARVLATKRVVRRLANTTPCERFFPTNAGFFGYFPYRSAILAPACTRTRK
jgi:hypothetical protein